MLQEALEDVAGVRFNSCLLNYYRDGQDSMGWHSDNEPLYGPTPTIGLCPRTWPSFVCILCSQVHMCVFVCMCVCVCVCVCARVRAHMHVCVGAGGDGGLRPSTVCLYCLLSSSNHFLFSVLSTLSPPHLKKDAHVHV